MDVGSQVHQGLAGTPGYRPVYAIFEGGGARGITHIGALKALEHEQLAIAGVAGSSAGAIVAALAALGFRADELFDAKRQTDILQGHGDPISVLGRGTWRRFGLIRRFGLKLVLVAVLALAGALTLVATGQRARYAFVALALAAACIVAVIALIWPVLRKRGLFDSSHLQTVLNAIFLAKLNAHRTARAEPPLPADHRVTFADIDPATTPECATLKIIVSELRSGQSHVFDHNTPGAVLAAAVAASASIPFAFRPPTIPGHDPPGLKDPIYVDGGLISNLPVWSFSAEKRSLERSQGGPPIPIIAFSLDDTVPVQGGRRSLWARLVALTPWPYLLQVIRTGIFGSQRVVQRFVPDLVMIGLQSPLETMRFDCSRRDALAAFDSGFKYASSELLKLRRTAEITKAALDGVLAAFRGDVFAERSRAGAAMPRLRVNLVDPSDDRRTAFRIVASVGMERDADDRLELDTRNRIAPQAFQRGLDQFDVVRDASPADLAMTKYERALVCPRLHSVISVPIFKPRSGNAEIERVLCIDSTDSLEDIFTNTVIMGALRDRSVTASSSLIATLTGVA